VGHCLAADLQVTKIRAVHRHGQTFVTWNDVAEGEEGAKYRYSLYRADEPITDANLDQAELCFYGMLNNSARLFGTAFNQKDRLDPTKPTCIIEAGGKPLPMWSGLAVRTTTQTAKAYYAVRVTDEKYQPLAGIVAGENATTEPLDETVAPIEPIKLYDSKQRETYVEQTSITGQKDLPLSLRLPGSQAQGGGAGSWGDYYLYFGTPEMGYRDGLPGVFSVQENRRREGNLLVLVTRDALEHPSGARAMETYSLGYYCIPQWASQREGRVYPFTEKRLLWITQWVVDRYQADPQRIHAGGASSGGVAAWNFGLRRPELFAAVYPSIGRVRRVPAVALEGRLARDQQLLMDDGKTPYYDRVDGPKFVAEHKYDLPFVGFCCGRHDGYATWRENIDMVKALTAARHGFAFAWNNGGHGEGGRAMALVTKYYPAEKFARNQSYPAFSHSSLDQDMGHGDPADGDLEGGINLGFQWSAVVDEPRRWSVAISNDLATDAMTVDVTPRRCQNFKVDPGERLQVTVSTGGSREVVADRWGLVTIERVKLRAKTATTISISR
jgi:hypothetical protein